MTNLGPLAFACGQPGTPATEDNIRQLVLDAVPGRAMTVGDIAVLRSKLPAAERMSRIAIQRTRLAGLTLEGPLEVAYQVYDVISGMVQAGSFRYLAPNKCITRMQEITMQKPPKELKLDSTAQRILVKDVQGDQLCPVATELDVLEAMTRRSLAFDLVGLIDFETFQKWNQHLFQILTGLQAAERDSIAKGRPEGIRPDAGAFPGRHQTTGRWYTTIGCYRPGPAARSHRDVLHVANPSSSASNKGQTGEATAEIPRIGAAIGRASPKPTTKPQTRCGRRAKTKGGHMYPSGGKLPIALKGCASCLPDGSRLCFAYNIDGCNKAQAGETCERGYHLCATKGCGEKRPHHS